MNLQQLNVKIYADGADKIGIINLYKNPLIHGITTNPSLMRKAGIENYQEFALEILKTVKTKPISYEVFSDDFSEMRLQAFKMKEWQENVYVKIPVTNTKGESSLGLISELAKEGVKLNVTAILTLEQVRDVAQSLQPNVPAVVSVFAGRIADTGRDPIPLMTESLALLRYLSKTELLWASVREVINIFQADACGCHIVTVPHDILEKAIKLCGKDLNELSLDTVKMFYQDAKMANFNLK